MSAFECFQPRLTFSLALQGTLNQGSGRPVSHFAFCRTLVVSQILYVFVCAHGGSRECVCVEAD